MKIPRIAFFITLIVHMSWLITHSTAQAQDSLEQPKHVINIHLTQLVIREVQVSYERKLSDLVALEAAVGMKIRRHNHASTQWMSYFVDLDQAMPLLPFSQSYYASAGGHFYFNYRQRRIEPYFSPLLFFRYNFYEDKYIEDKSVRQSDFYTVKQSQYQTIWGLKLLVGMRASTLRIGMTRIILDGFVGLGLRNKIIETIEYGRNRGLSGENVVLYHEPHTERKRSPYFDLPSLQAGLKLGVGWN